MDQKIENNQYISSAEDIVTSREDTRSGFISMALEKNYLAVPYIEEAKALKTIASKVSTPKDLIDLIDIRSSLISASGLSAKSLSYMNDDDITIAINGLIEEFLEPAGSNFADELVYRYLLVKGDALGGQARNLAGSLGERKFLRCLLSVLKILDIDYHWVDNEDKKWKAKPENEAGIEKRIKALSWERDGNNRILLMNVNVPIVNKNVDLCLLNGSRSELHLSGKNAKDSINRLDSRYISLGELKGGIDPAGADEHWKTANTALNRIRSGFKTIDLNVSTFFVGAAIESSMAKEIFNQLENGTMTNAANLHKESQLIELCYWLLKE